MNILVIEDDSHVADYIKKGLQELSHNVEIVQEGRLGLTLTLENSFDVIVVDRMLPDVDGIDVVKSLRKMKCHVPVLFLSNLCDIDEKVYGLEAGGDDYLAKPFALSELSARVEALSRRGVLLKNQKQELVYQELRIEPFSQKVYRAKNVIELKSKEYQLLKYFMENPEKILTRTMLLENVWGYYFDIQTNVLDVHVSNLRRKIDDGFSSKYLQTVRGVGYKLEISKK